MGIYLPLLILSLTVAPPPITTAQTTAAPPSNYPYSAVNAIGGFIFLVVLGAVLIACAVTACICLCCCGCNTINRTTAVPLRASVAATSRPFRLPPRGGLDPAVIKSFPILNYSEIKHHKISNSKGSALSCAVCVSEFGDNEGLRLLPKCDHAFHPECIDTWLKTHSTCPICRAILSQGVEVQNQNQVSITVVENQRVETEPRERVMRMFPRPHSTGHSLVGLEEERERYTLRLTEEVRRRLDQGGTSDRWLFMTPPFSFRTGSLRSTKMGVVEGDFVTTVMKSPFECLAGKSEQMPSRPPV